MAVTLHVVRREPELVVAGYPSEHPLPCGWSAVAEGIRCDEVREPEADLGWIAGMLLRWEDEVTLVEGERRERAWFDDTEYGVWVAHEGGRRGIVCASLPYDRRLFDPLLVVLVSYVPYAYWVEAEPVLTSPGPNAGPRRDEGIRSAVAWLVGRNRLRLSPFERGLFLAALAESCPTGGQRCDDERCASSR
ncbi:MAG: hypothetical protein NZ761_01930 [Dehalococcoidia bacterium]|nr:hypothetical protein [Dehalococcoidia bacterium]